MLVNACMNAYRHACVHTYIHTYTHTHTRFIIEATLTGASGVDHAIKLAIL